MDARKDDPQVTQEIWNAIHKMQDGSQEHERMISTIDGRQSAHELVCLERYRNIESNLSEIKKNQATNASVIREEYKAMRSLVLRCLMALIITVGVAELFGGAQTLEWVLAHFGWRIQIIK